MNIDFNIHPQMGLKYWITAQIAVIIAEYFPVRIPESIMDVMHFTFWGCGIAVSIIALIEWIYKKYRLYKEYKKRKNG